MKLAEVTRIFKSGKNELLKICKPVSVLLWFREGHSTEHALIELVNRI